METSWLEGDAETIAGQVQSISQSWDDAALNDRGAFEFDLREAGMPAPDVAQALAVRDEVAGAKQYLDRQIRDFWATTKDRYITTPPEVERLYDAQASLGKRLRDWFSGREFRVDDTTTVDLRIPLFLLSAAPVPGCTASFEREETTEGELSWDLTIFGTGLSGANNLKVTATATFTAASGEAKAVFLPGSMVVEKVTVLEYGRETGRGCRIDVSRFTYNSELGLSLLPSSARLAAGDLVCRYPLAGDTSGALAKYKYSDERTGSIELSLGFKAFGADLKLKGQVKRSTSVEVTYELKGGFDYELRRFAEGDGLVWAK